MRAKSSASEGVVRANQWCERTSFASRTSGASRMSGAKGASERANDQASGPIIHSVFLAVLDHSAVNKLICTTTILNNNSCFKTGKNANAFLRSLRFKEQMTFH